MNNLLNRRSARWVTAMLLLWLQHAPMGWAQPANSPDRPLDDFTTRSVLQERSTLDYPSVRENDILWENRIWRIVETREKMNLPFVYPDAPLFSILREGVLTGQLTAYSTENDHFTQPLSEDQLKTILFRKEDITVLNFNTGIEETQTVSSDINWEDVQRYRIKEAWFFDARTSTMSVRILGIAPLINEYTEDGDFKFERPLFWIHYPSAREYLSHQKAYTAGNNLAATTSWEDMFEMRNFASNIIKENNLHDLKIGEYLTGTDMLLESDKIKNDLFNREMDTWQH